MNSPNKSAVVWEITLKCNLGCSHCGSRAGQSRAKELSTTEALDLVKQMAEIGIEEVGLIGGEAFLRPDWLEIAEAITKAGMRCSMVTGGFGVSLEMAKQMKKAGIELVSVSIDGLEATHDRLRGKKGSWQQCFKTMKHLQQVGIVVTCHSQVNRLSAPELPQLYERLRDAGVIAWKIGLTMPMGNAADHAEMILQPAELLDFYPMLARIATRARSEGIIVQGANNIGYYGPYERLLRENGGEWSFWQGCSAGLEVLGIDAEGTVKGCPTLPTPDYAGGNIRDLSLQEIVQTSDKLKFNLGAGTPQGTEHLWGFCKSCEYAEICRGGCSSMAHVVLNRRGNNPYCHHRVLALAKRGLRERIELVRQAPGNPFDHGEFRLIEEPINAPWPEYDPLKFTTEKIQWSDSWQKQPELQDKVLVFS